MNPIEFATALVDCTLEVHKLTDSGLSEPDAFRIRDAYICKPRVKERLVHDDPLCELLATYDVAQVEIGMISFLKDPMQNEQFIVIGKFEADPLKIVLPEEKVIVHELASRNHVLAHCASTPGQFLDALVLAARVLGRCSWDEDLSGNIDALRATAKDCGEAAGGLEYESFFKTLLGAW